MATRRSAIETISGSLLKYLWLVERIVRIKYQRIWTAEDDAELRRLAALNLGTSRIAAKLKRIPTAVLSRAAVLEVDIRVKKARTIGGQPSAS